MRYVLGNWLLRDKRRCCGEKGGRWLALCGGNKNLVCEVEGRQCGASEHVSDREGRVMAVVLT